MCELHSIYLLDCYWNTFKSLLKSKLPPRHRARFGKSFAAASWPFRSVHLVLGSSTTLLELVESVYDNAFLGINLIWATWLTQWSTEWICSEFKLFYDTGLVPPFNKTSRSSPSVIFSLWNTTIIIRLDSTSLSFNNCLETNLALFKWASNYTQNIHVKEGSGPCHGWQI